MRAISIHSRLLADLAACNRQTRYYWWIVVIAGIGIHSFIGYGFSRPPFYSILQFVGLCSIVFFAGLFPVRIPGTNCVITPGDIFIFLACLTLGAPAATVIATLDSFVASSRSKSRWSTRIASAAISTVAMFLSASLFQLFERKILAQAGNQKIAIFSALFIFAIIYFISSSLLMAMYTAFKQERELLRFWWSNYSWLISTYAASASIAGIIKFGFDRFGFVTLLASAPVAVIVFSTFYFYFRQSEERENASRGRVEAAEAQAALAEKHLQEMQESEERFRSAFDYAAIGMALVSPDGRWMQVNASLSQILGYSEGELLLRDFQCLTHPDDLDPLRRSIAQLVSGQVASVQIEHRFLHHLGHDVWVSLNASSIREFRTPAQRLIFQIQNITDRKLAEARLIHDAFHDNLTGLPNRALFLDHLQMAIARNQRNANRAYAVLFLDFDRFKVINDSLGHLAGDELLVEVARRLKASVRPGDTIARLGGDEFTILVEDIHETTEAVAMAERIQKILGTPIKLSTTEVMITVSIGIAFGSPAYKRPEDVLRDADTAMYHAKGHGKDRFTVFDPSMHTRAMEELQLENDLRRAVDRKEFFLVYQPIVSLETAGLCGFEALVRWQHPERGYINPADFIPIAEETGLIVPLGEWVIEEACRQMKVWESDIGDAPLTMAINLSLKQLSNERIIDHVKGVLRDTELSPLRLKLEITESVVMENIEMAIRKLTELRNLGLKLSIDDFGTGYSSLSYLHRLPTDTLKVDRSFVFRMADNSENAEIVRTIVMLAKTLRMDVTAEGIENVEQLGHLQRLGVEHGQGYLFSKPISAVDATELCMKHQTWQAFEAQEAVFASAGPGMAMSGYTV